MIDHAIAAASYRNATEDRAAVIELADRIVAVVADGAGGIPGGGSAADIVVSAVKQQAAALVTPEACAALLLAADRTAEPVGESTAVIVVVHSTGIYGASCGDSEAWIVGEGGAIDRLTERQHLKRRIGSGRAHPVEFERPGGLSGTLILASDGLFRYARPEQIARIASSGESAERVAADMVNAVRTGSGDLLDDVVVVTIRASGTNNVQQSTRSS